MSLLVYIFLNFAFLFYILLIVQYFHAINLYTLKFRWTTYTYECILYIVHLNIHNITLYIHYILYTHTIYMYIYKCTHTISWETQYISRAIAHSYSLTFPFLSPVSFLFLIHLLLGENSFLITFLGYWIFMIFFFFLVRWMI